MSVSLYVGNLTWECDDTALNQLFTDQGITPHSAQVTTGRDASVQHPCCACFHVGL